VRGGEGRGRREGGREPPSAGGSTPSTMVATNQRDYATAISHMDMAGSHDKSSCRSATINNNIWTAGWRDGCRDSPSLNSVTRSPAPAIGASCYDRRSLAPPPPTLRPPHRQPILLRAMRAVPRANKSIGERRNGRDAGGNSARDCAARFGRHERAGRRFRAFRE